MITIRRIRPDDAAVLQWLRLAALLDAPAAFAMTHEEESAYTDAAWNRRAREWSAGDEAATFLALTDGDPVGLVGVYRPGPEGLAELVSMWVAPEARRRGVGRRLVDAVVSWAEASGCRRVELWVTQGNAPAVELYRAAGFEPTGDVTPLPSDPCKDELRMRRLI